MKTFIIRTITSVFFVAAVVTCFLDAFAMMVFFAFVTGMTMWEYTGLVNDHVPDTTINRFISTTAGVFFFLAMASYCCELSNAVVFIPYLLTIVYLFVSELYTGNKNAIHDWAYTMLGQMYIALPMSMINVLAFRATPGGTVFYALAPLSVFLFLWVNDAGAYCVGSLIGKHKLFPRISPGKSWEGSIGGGLLVIAVAVLLGWIEGQGLIPDDGGNAVEAFSIPQWIGMGLVVVFFGTWGDLVESLIKRTIGIKDSGNILPGHGGMLDRFDSSLMAFPACVIYVYLLQML